MQSTPVEQAYAGWLDLKPLLELTDKIGDRFFQVRNQLDSTGLNSD